MARTVSIANKKQKGQILILTLERTGVLKKILPGGMQPTSSLAGSGNQQGVQQGIEAHIHVNMENHVTGIGNFLQIRLFKLLGMNFLFKLL
jgi:hypothetical protein